MTNFEYITSMPADVLAATAIKPLLVAITTDHPYMSLFDATVHPTKEAAIAHNKEWLAKDVDFSV